jgi:hypothetical protein
VPPWLVATVPVMTVRPSGSLSFASTPCAAATLSVVLPAVAAVSSSATPGSFDRSGDRHGRMRRDAGIVRVRDGDRDTCAPPDRRSRSRLPKEIERSVASLGTLNPAALTVRVICPGTELSTSTSSEPPLTESVSPGLALVSTTRIDEMADDVS